MEGEFQDKLGTRVHIDRSELGGQIKIDFFSVEDLRTILDSINKSEIEKKPGEMLENYIAKNEESSAVELSSTNSDESPLTIEQKMK